MADSADRLADNPFFVLGVGTDATRMEIEREAQKLLGMLELGFAEAATYATPIGPRPRTSEAVRAAVAALRDPHQRLVAELWARHAPTSAGAPAAGEAAAGDAASAGSTKPRAPLTRRRLGWP